jgi:hypothetical protein
MLKKSFLSAAVFAVLFSLGAINVSAQSAKPKKADKTPRNVVDFYLILPNKYAGNFSPATRQKYLKENGTIDTANGYLEVFSPKENEPRIYVAIFKRDEGGYLVSVASGSFASEKPFRYYFLDYDGKNWTEVSKKVLPPNFNFADYGLFYPCELPRFNRTISCRNSAGQLTYLGWTGKDFVIE